MKVSRAILVASWRLIELLVRPSPHHAMLRWRGHEIEVSWQLPPQEVRPQCSSDSGSLAALCNPRDIEHSLSLPKGDILSVVSTKPMSAAYSPEGLPVYAFPLYRQVPYPSVLQTPHSFWTFVASRSGCVPSSSLFSFQPHSSLRELASVCLRWLQVTGARHQTMLIRTRHWRSLTPQEQELWPAPWASSG